ncbi:hypothetical protein SARC_15496, partial [Sphaeroforma arctica JP610]
ADGRTCKFNWALDLEECDFNDTLKPMLEVTRSKQGLIPPSYTHTDTDASANEQRWPLNVLHRKTCVVYTFLMQ